MDGKQSKLLPYLLVSVAVLLVYLPSFTGDFILDDHPFIRDNSYIREWHPIGSYLFQEDGYDDESGGHTGYYRPLINLSYTLDYKIWGMTAPGFRITNVILHLLVCFILFAVYNLVLKQRNIALVLALIFSLHPINTEAVAWIASRNNILATLFGITSLYCYIKAYRQQRFFYYSGSIVFFTFAVFSKEFGLMLLPIFFLYQRILNTRKQSLMIELREYLPFMIIGLFYFILRQNVTGSILTPWAFSDILTRVINFPYVLFLNLRLIFLPYNLHSYIIEYPERFLNIGTLLSILLFLITLYLIWRHRKNRVLLFSVLAFFFAVLPVSGVVPTAAPTIISMRWLYFSTPFILIILSKPLEKVLHNKRQIILFLLPFIALYLGINAYTLNKHLWYSSETFFKQEVLHFDNTFYADGLAKIYYNNKEFDLAEEYFVKSFERGGKRSAHNLLLYAFLLYEKGDVKNARLYQEKAEKYYMNKSVLGQFYHNQGLIALKLLDLDNAVKFFRKAIIFSSEEPLYWENLGVTYGMLGDHGMAVNALEKGITKGVKSTSIRSNLVFAYIQNNDCQKAISLLERMKYNADEEAMKWIKKRLIDTKRCIDGQE
jgi:tetratricopeptide (TPR) repeat protein